MKISKKTIGLVLLTGCLNGQQNSTLTHIEERFGVGEFAGKKSPVVEAYIEYTGPQKKWAGAPTFILHIQARDPKGEARVWVTPPVVAHGRTLASENATAKKTDAMSNEVARERLQDLANEIQNSPRQKFAGCLYPVRAWLIKSDGGIVEESGCRGAGAWVKKASQLTSDFVQTSLISQN